MVAAVGNSVIKKYHGKKSFGNREWQNLFAKTLNKSMGYLDLRASFEYYDIIVSTIDSELRQHIDHKNEDRTNYNHTYVCLLVCMC